VLWKELSGRIGEGDDGENLEPGTQNSVDNSASAVVMLGRKKHLQRRR
jgi:hypothetical protein